MAEGETRSFLIQFMAETGDAVTAMNWLGRSMQKFPSMAVSAAAQTEVAMAEMDLALKRAGESAWEMSDAYTAMGRDSTEMIRAAGAAAKVGIEGSSNLIKFTETARDFGFVTKTSADQASAALSKLSLALEYETPEQIERLASGMTVLSRKTDVSASQISSLITAVGPLGKEVGLTESAMMGLSVSLSRTGLSAEDTAGPLAGLIDQMKYMQLGNYELANALGLSEESLENFKAASPDKQLTTLLHQLGQMEQIHAEQTLQELQIASGNTATKIWEAARRSEELSTYMGWASEAMKENTALSGESAKMQKTLAFQLSELKKQLQAVYQMAGKWLAPVLSLLVQSLRGFLFIVMAVPKPLLAVAAGISAVVGGMITMAWLSSTKLVAGILKKVWALKQEMTAVGGLTGLYKALTRAEVVNQAIKRASAMKTAPTLGMFGTTEGIKAAGGLKSVVGAASGGAGTTGMFGMMTAAAGALGVSLAVLVGIVLAVIAALVIMGIMIYKGVKMMQEGSDKAKAFGAMLLLLTGPIGALVLGMMLLAKPIKRFKDEVVKAFTPLYETLQKLMPIIYAFGALILLAFSPILAPIAGLVALIYILMPIVVGLFEAFAEGINWAIEPFIPLAEKLGELFSWIGGLFGATSEEGIGLWDVLKLIGKIIGYIGIIIASPFLLGIWLIGQITRGVIALAEVLYAIGEILIFPFRLMWLHASKYFGWIGDRFDWLVGLIMTPVEWISNLWNETMMKVHAAIQWIIGPLKAVSDAFWTIHKAVTGVSDALFGSSPWHVKESMEGDVIPALKDTSEGFRGVGDSAMGVHQVAKAKGGVVPKPSPDMAELEASKIGAAGAAAGMPGAMPSAAPPGGLGEILVKIPVTLTLDGMVIGKTMVEQMINLRERAMNAPGFPMRGVEPAF